MVSYLKFKLKKLPRVKINQYLNTIIKSNYNKMDVKDLNIIVY